MKKVILILGSIVTLILAVLWYYGKVNEPIVAIGTGILTVIGYVLVPDESSKSTKTVIKQKHSGSGDNVAGNKIVKK